MQLSLADCFERKIQKDFTRFEDEGDQAFRQLSKSITTALVQALCRSGILFSVDIDASGYQVEVVLCQTHPDVPRKAVAFCSGSLNCHEKNYPTTEKECLPVVWEVHTLLPYLERILFIVHTDHAAIH